MEFNYGAFFRNSKRKPYVQRTRGKWRSWEKELSSSVSEQQNLYIGIKRSGIRLSTEAYKTASNFKIV